MFDAHLQHRKLCLTWVAETAGGAVGLCSLLVAGEEGEIDSVGVRSNERSQGIDHRLIEVATEKAKRQGVHYLGPRPAARNVEAMRRYHDMGFTALGQIEQLMDVTEPTQPEWKPGATIHGMDFRY